VYKRQIQDAPVILVRSWNSQLIGRLLGGFHKNVGNGDQVGFRDAVHQVLGVQAANPPCSDDTHVDRLVHVLLSASALMARKRPAQPRQICALFNAPGRLLRSEAIS
jgi:hypothetical protein